MNSLRAAACLVLLGTFALAAPTASPEQLAWAPGLPAAQEEARQRKVPLMVVVNMDNERGNQRMIDEVYTAPAVRESAKRLAVTIASIGKHAEVDDPKRGCRVCSRFGRVTCAEHFAAEEAARKLWLKIPDKVDVDSPRHIFVSPDGKLLFERVWTLEPAELVKLMDRAVASCTPESLAAWDTTEARLLRAVDFMACVRAVALRDLLAAHDPAIDAKLFDLIRHNEIDEIVRDVAHAFASDMTPTRGEGMTKLLSAPSAVVRIQAAAAVAALKQSDAFEVLSAAYAKEKTVDVKCVLVRALAVCGGDPAKARELVLHAAKSADGALRVHAVVALAPWAKEDAVVDALRKLPSNDKLPEGLRSAAVWTLGLSGRKDVADDLRPLADERSKYFKRVVQAALARLEGQDDPQYFWVRGWVARLPGQVVLAEPGPK